MVKVLLLPVLEPMLSVPPSTFQIPSAKRPATRLLSPLLNITESAGPINAMWFVEGTRPVLQSAAVPQSPLLAGPVQKSVTPAATACRVTLVARYSGATDVLFADVGIFNIWNLPVTVEAVRT